MTSSEPVRIAQTIRLRPSSVQEYKECHANVWPAVLAQIKQCNITDYSIFLDETPVGEHGHYTLFSIMKYTGSNLEMDMAKMKENPVVRKWWEMTDAMQETMIQGSQGSLDEKGWWKVLDEVFRYE